MSRFYSLLIVAILSLNALGQSTLGLKMHGGISEILTNFSSPTFSKENVSRLSYYGGFFYNYKTSTNSFINLEFIFTCITGKEKHWNQWHDTLGNPLPVYDHENLYRYGCYASFPFHYGMTAQKLTIMAGLRSSLLLIGREGKDSYIDFPKGSAHEKQITYSTLLLDNFDFGVSIATSFACTNKLSIEFSYYRSLKNVYPTGDYVWKIKQSTIGLLYILRKKNPTSEK